MNKLMIAALAATTAIATPALANTDTTTVWATIAPVCTIDGPGDNGSISLSGSTALGNVTVVCNDPQGFTASVSSANGSKLLDSSSPTAFDYKLGFGGYGSYSLAAPLSINSHSYGLDAAAINGTSLAVSLNVTQPTGPLFAGTYSDVITWTINGN